MEAQKSSSTRQISSRRTECLHDLRIRATGAHEAALALSDLFTVSSQGDDTQDFVMQDGTKLFQLQMKYTRKNALESLYKMRIRESVQLVTFSAMYEQENDQNRAVPSYQRLKTEVRRHIDQTIRTRNVRVRSERIGVLVISQNGKNVSVEGDQENAFSGKQKDPVQEETHAVSAMETISVDSQHNRPLLLQDRRHIMTEEDF